MVTSATVRGGGHVGWAGSGLGGLVGFFKVEQRCGPNSAPRPTPIALHSLSRACGFPEVCAGISPGWGATTAPRTHTQTHAHTPPHLHSFGPPRPKKPPDIWESDQFKRPGLETNGGGEGKWGRRKGREEIQQNCHPPLQHTRVLLQRRLPAHPVTKGGDRQIPGRAEARCHRHSPARPPRPVPSRSEFSALLGCPCRGVGWGRALGAPDLEGRFQVWGVETPHPARRTCSGVPLPPRKAFFGNEHGVEPSLGQRPPGGHPTPALSADVGAPRAAWAPGTRRSSGDHAGPGHPWGNPRGFSEPDLGIWGGDVGRLVHSGTGGARSELKRPTTVQLASLPQSSVHNRYEIWDAWELKVWGKLGWVGEGTLLVALGGQWVRCFFGGVGLLRSSSALPMHGTEKPSRFSEDPSHWICGSGDSRWRKHRTWTWPPLLDLWRREAGSESEWRQLPRPNRRAGFRAGELGDCAPVDLFMCAKSWGRELGGGGG